MTKLKRIICMFVCAIMAFAFVTGCALVEQDVDYYNNTVVATVGADIRVTKGQLIAAFNSYGYQYVSQYGMKIDEAYAKVLEDLIDREIFVELSIQSFSGHLSASDIAAARGKKGVDSLFYKALYENEKAEARKQAFDAIEQYYKQLQDKVREERSLVFAKNGGEDPNQKKPVAAMDTFKEFQPLVTREAENTAFYMSSSASEGKELLVGIVPAVWSPDIDKNDDGIVRDVKTVALDRLVRFLQNNENGMRVGVAEAGLVEKCAQLSDKQRAVIGRELGRMIEDSAKSILARRFQEIFDLGINAPIDRSNYAGDRDYLAAVEQAIRDAGQASRAGELNVQAREHFRTQVLSAYNRYQKGMDTADTLTSKVLDGLDGIYWLPTEVAENNFTVSHILIQYTDEQKAEIDRIKSEFSLGGLDEKQYRDALDGVKSRLATFARDADGVAQGENPVPATQILAEVANAISGTAAERANTFRDFIYKYNQDPGMMNAEYEYVLGVKKNAGENTFTPNSKMVEEFTRASLELFGYEQRSVIVDGKNTLQWFEKKEFDLERGALYPNLVFTDYGAHIIMLTRRLSDFIYSGTPSTNAADAMPYLYAPLNSYGEHFGSILFSGTGNQPKRAPAKTTFDTIVAQLNRPEFEVSRGNKIAAYKGEREGGRADGRFLHQIKTFPGNYKDLLKK